VKTMLIVGPLLVGITVLLYTIISNLLRVWLDHRVKLALLETLEHDPNAPATAEELQALLEEHAIAPGRKSKLDYCVVGMVLLVIGTCTGLAGYIWGHGMASAGVYFGGVTCIAVGAILVLLGLLLRYLARLPIDPRMK
jgi:hypothetical protein